ncbi:MAG: hypothetical protein LBR22_04310 [Desulfovibrio sp.]|nr:hypothetical protein [Desulfovibrio sp.]
MRKIWKPTSEELAGLRKQAFATGKTEEQWLAAMANGYARIIRKSPRQYRMFGPYWWGVKRIMLSQGVTDFGTGFDAAMEAEMDCGNPVENMLAAYAFAEKSLAWGRQYSSIHMIPAKVEGSDDDDPEWEDIEYLLADEDVEAIVFASGLR